MKRPQELTNLIIDIDRERVERARQTPLEQKFLAGFRLFQRSMALMKAGVRSQFPGISDEEVDRLVEERLEQNRDKSEYRP